MVCQETGRTEGGKGLINGVHAFSDVLIQNSGGGVEFT